MWLMHSFVIRAKRERKNILLLVITLACSKCQKFDDNKLPNFCPEFLSIKLVAYYVLPQGPKNQ